MLVEAGMTKKLHIFFNESNNIGYGQEEVPMNKSKHFEYAYIFLSTITKIKLTTKKDKGHYLPLNVLCNLLNFKTKQFTSDILECSNMTSTHSTLKKIWYFPCPVILLLIWNLVNLPHWINFGSKV